MLEPFSNKSFLSCKVAIILSFSLAYLKCNKIELKTERKHENMVMSDMNSFYCFYSAMIHKKFHFRRKQ